MRKVVLAILLLTAVPAAWGKKHGHDDDRDDRDGVRVAVNFSNYRIPRGEAVVVRITIVAARCRLASPRSFGAEGACRPAGRRRSSLFRWRWSRDWRPCRPAAGAESSTAPSWFTSRTAA